MSAATTALAGFLNAVGVEREAGVTGLPNTAQEES
jgi:hypothetical protein